MRSPSWWRIRMMSLLLGNPRAGRCTRCRRYTPVPPPCSLPGGSRRECRVHVEAGMQSHAGGRAGPANLSDIVVFGAVIPGTRLVTVREFHDYETTAQLTFDHFRFVANHKELSAVILGEALEVPPVAVSLVFHGVLDVDQRDDVCRHSVSPVGSSRMVACQLDCVDTSMCCPVDRTHPGLSGMTEPCGNQRPTQAGAVCERRANPDAARVRDRPSANRVGRRGATTRPVPGEELDQPRRVALEDLHLADRAVRHLVELGLIQQEALAAGVRGKRRGEVTGEPVTVPEHL